MTKDPAYSVSYSGTSLLLPGGVVTDLTVCVAFKLREDGVWMRGPIANTFARLRLETQAVMTSAAEMTWDEAKALVATMKASLEKAGSVVLTGMATKRKEIDKIPVGSVLLVADFALEAFLAQHPNGVLPVGEEIR